MTRKKLPKKKKSTPGRIGVYNDGLKNIAYKLCSILGAKDQDLADYFGVSIKTIEHWKRYKEEFSEAVNKGKLIADSRVAESFYKRAIGYSHPDTVILTNRVTEYNEEGKPVRSFNQPLIVPTIKHYPPDAYACNKWLTARQREKWAEISEIHHKHSGSVSFRKIEDIPIEDFSPEEQQFLFEIGMKQLTNGINQN